MTDGMRLGGALLIERITSGRATLWAECFTTWGHRPKAARSQNSSNERVTFFPAVQPRLHTQCPQHENNQFVFVHSLSARRLRWLYMYYVFQEPGARHILTCPARTSGSIHWPGGKSMKRMAFSERIFRCSLVIASAFPAHRRCWNAHSAMQDGPLVQSGHHCRLNTQNPRCSCTKICCAYCCNSTSR